MPDERTLRVSPSSFWFRSLLGMCHILWSAILWFLSNPVSAQPACTSLALEALRSSIEEAEVHLLRFNPVGAMGELSLVTSNLLCLQAVPEPQALSRAYMLLGISRHLLGDERGASQAFSAALRFDDGLQWDDTFGQSGLSAFRMARESLGCSHCGILELPSLRSGDATLFIDGHQIPGSPRQLRLTPGDHLLQVTLNGEVVWSQMAHAKRSDEAPLIVPVQAEYSAAAPSGHFVITTGLWTSYTLTVQAEARLNFPGPWGIKIIAGIEQPLIDDITSTLLGALVDVELAEGPLTPFLAAGAERWYFQGDRIGRLLGEAGLRFQTSSPWVLSSSVQVRWSGGLQGLQLGANLGIGRSFGLP